jgi:hypothetical protein
MSKYKIHIDKPLPDPKRVAQHKDFDALYRDYQVNTRFDFWRNLYRKPAVFAGMVATVAILFLLFQAVETETAQPWVNSPVASYQPVYQSIPLETSEISEIALAEDLLLIVPPEAFVKADGADATGSIDLQVRTLNHPADLLLSGLAQDPGSQLNVPVLVEVRATQAGDPLLLQQPLQLRYRNCELGEGAVALQQSTHNSAWQIAALSGTEVDWLPPNPDHIGPAPAAPEWLAMANEEELVPKSMGVLPQKPGRPFGVKVKNLANYPQFQGYEQMYWEYLDVAGSTNPWEAGLIGEGQGWEDVRVRPKAGRNSYELRFARRTDEGLEFKIVEAFPMFEARSQEEADQLYQERNRAYTEAVQAREALLQRDRDLQAERLAELQAYETSLAEWEAAQQDSVPVCEQILTVNQVGFVGVGLPVSGEQTPHSLAIFRPDGRPLTTDQAAGHLYLAVEAGNTLWQIPVENDQLLIPAAAEAGVFWLGQPEVGLWRASWQAGQTELHFEALPEFEDPANWLMAPLFKKVSELN